MYVFARMGLPPQQPGGELPPADPTTRADHEAVQSRRSRRNGLYLPMIRSPIFFSRRRTQDTAAKFHAARSQAFATWAEVTGVAMDA